MCRLRRVFVAMRRFGRERNKLYCLNLGSARGISLVAVAGYITGSDAPRVNPPRWSEETTLHMFAVESLTVAPTLLE